MNRRAFLRASTIGLGGLRFGSSVMASPATGIALPTKRARSTILFFLCGGASHIDMWDLKPDAPREYRGPFNPIRTSAPGVYISEHLPMTAKQGRHLAIVRSVTDFGLATGDHHAGYYYNLTGNVPDLTFRTEGNNRRPYPTDAPHMACVVGQRLPRHPRLPQVITLPYKPSRAPYTRPGQFAGRLGLEHDPFYLYGTHEEPLNFTAPSLTLSEDVGRARLAERKELLEAVNTARRMAETDPVIGNYTTQQQKAFELLANASTADAFDLRKEPRRVRERYGEHLNGMSLLMARRLAEAGVPFITVFWRVDGINSPLAKKCRSAGGWDTHGDNFNCLKEDLLPRFDRCYSALIEDLHERGLLDETLVVVTSEMGRKPKIGDPRSGGGKGAGRDHWTACQSVVLAGGGIRGGQTYGATDRFGEYPVEHAMGPESIAHTVYHAMGIDDLKATDATGRPFNLLEKSRPITGLF
ncbi:MAG: DUF1501 domain-containing protein [Verrucomicrobiae bacterium]|nr:DUF1501 domain-containing protein [Verrucomicrobiae bacterium]